MNFEKHVDGQISLFTMNKVPYKITKPIRLIELFGGIGAQAKALERINPSMSFEHYRLVEFDKYPVASYNAIHGTDFVPLDITKIHGEDLGIVDKDKYTYLLTHSLVKTYPSQAKCEEWKREVAHDQVFCGKSKDC